MPNYLVADLASAAPIACPCGSARRAFAPSGEVASMHVTEIDANARTHYHRRMTELYLILEGEGHMELDGDRIPVRPMTTVLIRPGCRHRAVVAPGQRMKIVNVPVPAFDADDEWFDDDEPPAASHPLSPPLHGDIPC